MIQVDKLTRRYGETIAVDRIAFTVGRGEVVGLLGPNGAGKTTTMRMLTTYLAPTSGRAILAGRDAIDDPLGVRRRVGYLPENVPLYPEMRVRDYLDFRARLRDVPRAKRRAALDRVIARCKLDDVESRVVGQLSKGYRQRVGLAEAMVHDPDILILDEPTAGLDPIQIREVRDLIRELGEAHTILLSTHILPEVEAVCRRVILIAGGRIAMDETLERLRSGTLVEMSVRGPVDAVRKSLEVAPGVAKVVVSGRAGEATEFVIQPRGGGDVREGLAARIVQNGWGLLRIDLRQSTLEERFVQAVGRGEESEPVGASEAA